MNIQEIKKMAKSFRQAADKAFEYGAFGSGYPFSDFPHECCDDMCDLFGQFLLQNGVSVFKVHGTYRYDNWDNVYSHVWLKLEDDTIIDLTGDQYKDNQIMRYYDNFCYIGPPNCLHNLFPQEEQQYYPYFGIDNYGDEITKKRLWKLYDSILSFYKND